MLIMKNIFLTLYFILSLYSELTVQVKLPEDFIFGVGSSAYQIEGAWNTSGKGVSIWDHYTHTYPHLIADNTNGDVACDSYHKYKDDIKILKELNVQTYRVSISWTRIYPSGLSQKLNPDGKRYYNDLFDELLKHNITPLVALFHWDLPQDLQDIGGFANPLFINYFREYARACFELFGDKVKLWATFNEPYPICFEGYGVGYLAPGIKLSGRADYLCTHHLLLAHAQVYDLYNKRYRRKQNGKIGIILFSAWYFPKTNSSEDKAAAQDGMIYMLDVYVTPLIHGHYPKEMVKRIGELSREEDFAHSRLPSFTKKESEMLKGSFDYLGINYYTSSLTARSSPNTYPVPSNFNDRNIDVSVDPNWPKTITPMVESVPEGLYELLMYVKKKYKNPKVLVTENGLPDNGTLNDTARINYLKGHVKSITRAIEDGANVLGLCVWSLMDNFQWRDGFTARFGLYYTNITSPDIPRIPKASAKWYRDLIKTTRGNNTDNNFTI